MVQKDLRQDSGDDMNDEVPVGRRGEGGDVRESLFDGDHGSVSTGEDESLRLSSGKGDEGGVEDGSGNSGRAIERGGGEGSGEDVVEHYLSDERSVSADIGGESSEGLERSSRVSARSLGGGEERLASLVGAKTVRLPAIKTGRRAAALAVAIVTRVVRLQVAGRREKRSAGSKQSAPRSQRILPRLRCRCAIGTGRDADSLVGGQRSEKSGSVRSGIRSVSGSGCRHVLGGHRRSEGEGEGEGETHG